VVSKGPTGALVEFNWQRDVEVPEESLVPVPGESLVPVPFLP